MVGRTAGQGRARIEPDSARTEAKIHYDLAKQHVIEAEGRVARQRQLVRELNSAGRDTRLAEELLFHMLQTLSFARAHLQVIEAELVRDDE
jgi:hypothetical protein